MKRLKQTVEKAKRGWGLIVACLTAVSLVYGGSQAYNYYTMPEIAGEWEITLTVNSSTYKAYIGDVTVIRAYFSQAGESVTGNGEKWMYRGKLLDYDQHRKLTFQGCLDGSRLTVNYTLFGLKRETTGIMDVEITDGGTKMRGSFSGTAADTRGTITGFRKLVTT